jgi:hypothetical protein
MTSCIRTCRSSSGVRQVWSLRKTELLVAKGVFIMADPVIGRARIDVDVDIDRAALEKKLKSFNVNRRLIKMFDFSFDPGPAIEAQKSITSVTAATTAYADKAAKSIKTVTAAQEALAKRQKAMAASSFGGGGFSVGTAKGPVIKAPAGVPLGANPGISDNAIASVGNAVGRAAAAAAILGAAVSMWPYALGVAGVAATSYAVTALRAARIQNQAEKLIYAKSSLPLSNKGTALLPMAADATAAQGMQSLKYVWAALGQIPTGIGIWAGKIGSAVTGLGTGVGGSIAAFGRRLEEAGATRGFAGGALAKIIGSLEIFSGSLLRIAGSIPAALTGILKGFSGGFGAIFNFLGGAKRNAGSALVGKTEEATLLGGRVGGISGFLASRFASGQSQPDLEKILAGAASRASRQSGIAGNRGELTAIAQAVAQAQTGQRLSQLGQLGQVGGVGVIGGIQGRAGQVQQSQLGQQGQQGQASSGGMGFGTLGIGMAVVGGAIIAPIMAAAKAFAAFGDQLDKMSQKTGIGAESLSGLMHAAKLANLSGDQLGNGLKKMQQNIVAAATGSASAKANLHALGMSVEDLKGRSADEQFGIFADKISGIKDPAIRTAAAMGIFGRAGVDLLPMLATGSEGLAKYMVDAKLLGVVMSTETAEAAARLEDQTTRLQGSFSGLSFAIGSAVAPVLADLINYVIAGVVEVRNFVSENKLLIVTVLGVGAGIAAAGASILALMGALTGIGLAMSALPLAATGGAIAALVVGFIVLGDTISGVLGYGSVGFAGFLSEIQVGGSSIGQWLTAGFLQAMKGFEIVQQYVVTGFSYITAAGQTLAQSLAGVFGGFGEAIARGFWTAVQGVVDGIKWLADKVLKAGYELHLIDDNELIAADKAISQMQSGIKGFTDKKKQDATDVYSGSDQTDYFAQAAAKAEAAAKTAEAQINALQAAQEAVFSDPATSTAGLNFDAIKTGLNSALSGYQATLAQVQASEAAGAGKRLGTNGIDMDSIAKPQKVFGSFSGAALGGAVGGQSVQLQKEGNNLLKQIAENTKAPAVGLFQ